MLKFCSWKLKAKFCLFIILILFSMIMLFNLASAFSPIVTGCYSYTANSSCLADSNCTWKSSPWGSWCEEINCWNLYTQNECLTTWVPNKNCTWQSSQSYGWCENVNCWSFSGTNETACSNNSRNLNCGWRGECYNTGASPNVYCWNYATEGTCENVTGCSWGNCNQKSCWDYTSSSSCEGKTGYDSNNCTWNSQYNYCYEKSCWDYSNQSACETSAASLNCGWKYGYCSKKYCSDFGSNNETHCVNNTANLSCSWNSQWNYCEEKGCWNYKETACKGEQNCNWKTSQNTGWCNEVNCWSWDSWSGGNESQCVSNPYGLTCLWSGNPSGNATNGWCYKDNSKVSCANLTTENACIDTYYCWWQYSDWNNITAGGQCKTPGDWNINTNTTILNDWNPGCYIFDLNSTDCNKVVGCNYTSGQCVATNVNITNNGLGCSYINDSNLCNKISVLSNCCLWQSNNCSASKTVTSCYQVDTMPEGATYCEDTESYTSQTLCEQIASYPWYMPCDWDNSTERCKFKSTDVWGNDTQNLIKIENRKNCEAAGGSWIIENYCEGNISVPTGRCEYKFNDEKNCDKACFACEYKSDGTAYNSTASAKAACLNSKLGFCEFDTDSAAKNGYGFCEANDEFKHGRATNCDTDCGSCTFKGDPNAAEEKNTPRFYCEEKKAGKPECKWIADALYPTDLSKGYCASNSEKSCADRCDKCYSKDICATRTGNCTWDEALFICKQSTGGAEMEICWDGVDNDNNGKIDCGDSKCFSDSYCGGAPLPGEKDCFIYAANATCSTNNCTWVSENWGSWCDMPSAKCWKYDGDENTCKTNNATCDWHSGFGGFCEQNWTVMETCLNHNNTVCTNSTYAAKNCVWVVDEWCSKNAGWCESNWSYTGTYKDCWSLYSGGTSGLANMTGCQQDSACKWQEDTWCAGKGDNAGHCDHKSFTCWQYKSNTTCQNSTNTAWCTWEQDYYSPNLGWCNSKGTGGAAGTGDCWSKTNSTSCSDASCIWQSGFCDPKGFGEIVYSTGGGASIGGTGSSCYKFDGNQSGCGNQTGCGWMDNNYPSCQVDYSINCPQYSYNATLCDQKTSCRWKNDTYNPSGGWCDNLAFSVCQNSTNSNSQGNCTANPICVWSGYGCQAACFNSSYTTSALCTVLNVTGGTGGTAKLCAWNTGWCNPSTTTQMFNQVQSGEAMMLGSDVAGDASPASIDIIGYGMKDMGDAFGFGITVDNFRNSSLCNGQWFKSDNYVGTGRDTNIFYVYLDTDGKSTSNCALKNNASTAGYEFYFRYEGSFSNTTGQVVESLSAYKCVDSSWGSADIKLSSWKEAMCNEINGGMIAVSKDDLKKYPGLYNSSADLRVYVATGNETSNITNPADTVNTATYTTPGAIDFEINSMFDYGADTAKFENVLKNGYATYEDCFNGKDDDNDGATDCYDYGCDHADVCTITGVNAAGFVDTTAPLISGVKMEEYPDSAIIMFETTKPTNSTVFFWHNDSQCKSSPLNRTVFGSEALTVNVKNYTLTHRLELYDSANSLNYSLANQTTYYYKLQVCDDNGKCALSRCSSLTTSSASRCGYCNFVARIKAPSGWDVAYDVNKDGIYEHVQGKVCGPNAGMKINYTQGRRVHILLNKSDGTAYIEFLNVTLTKTGFNDKVRTISDSGAILFNTSATDSSGSTIGYVGLISETRDKIVNNLYPEICRIKIPKAQDDCNELWHCSDSGSGCINRTKDAVKLTAPDSSSCLWQLPYCEFSIWSTGQPGSTPSPSPSSSSSGGGGGGGGAATVIVADASEKNIAAFKTQVFAKIEQGASPVISVNKPEIAVNEIKFEAAKSLSNVEIKVSSLKEKPTVLPAANSVYQYLEIAPKNLKSTDINKATISFKVTKYWLGATGFKESDVALSRYASNVWNELPTKVLSSDADAVTYSAETPGFSYFAIVSNAAKAEKKAEEKPKEPEIKQQEVQKQDTQKEDAEQQKKASEQVSMDKLNMTKKGSIFSKFFEGNNLIWTTVLIGAIFLIALYFFPHQRTLKK